LLFSLFNYLVIFVYLLHLIYTKSTYNSVNFQSISMKKRNFVIGDIHGSYKALEQVLTRAKITPDDQLIFLGDYVDGWTQSIEVINKLISLKETHDCIFIKGNHDALLIDW